MTTLAAKIAVEFEEFLANVRNSRPIVTFEFIGIKFRELDAIVKMYVEGKVSAEEVSEALAVREYILQHCQKNEQGRSIDDQKVIMNAFMSSFVLEMLQILEISAKRFGTKQGMKNILADKYLVSRFSQEEQIEIQKIAYCTFFAHEKMMKLMHRLQAKYPLNNVKSEIDALDRRPIKTTRYG